MGFTGSFWTHNFNCVPRMSYVGITDVNGEANANFDQVIRIYEVRAWLDSANSGVTVSLDTGTGYRAPIVSISSPAGITWTTSHSRVCLNVPTGMTVNFTPLGIPCSARVVMYWDYL